MFRKVLIANRGEIAVRIIRALRELDIGSVAVYSDADRGALHVRMADEAAHIGPSPSTESYLRADRILEAAARHGAEAIHPGYGFLSENVDFAAACESAGITFIGPSSASIRQMGSKTEARKLAKSAGVPVVPGVESPVRDAAQARSIAAEIGYPVMLKAAAGGGGKGMRRVASGNELDAALRDASSEAERAFKSGEVYIEKLMERPRHIEIQVLGDCHGHIIHLGERECSLQRRHQKIVEECPSPFVLQHPDLRVRMGDAAVRAARAAGYYNAGTVEFLVDQDANFYFLEMNTRLQVEHPVTELVTGIDLVHWQLRIAAGENLTIRQEDVAWRGAAIECRLYAEDPENNFMPSPGEITALAMPAGPGIRLDSGVYSGWIVPVDSDPLLAKLAVYGETRPMAISAALRALSECSIGGIRTNAGLFRRILNHAAFRAGELHTGFIDALLAQAPEGETRDGELAAVLAAAVYSLANGTKPSPPERSSRWVSEGRARLLR